MTKFDYSKPYVNSPNGQRLRPNGPREFRPLSEPVQVVGVTAVHVVELRDRDLWLQTRFMGKTRRFPDRVLDAMREELEDVDVIQYEGPDSAVRIRYDWSRLKPLAGFVEWWGRWAVEHNNGRWEFAFYGVRGQRGSRLPLDALLEAEVAAGRASEETFRRPRG